MALSLFEEVVRGVSKVSASTQFDGRTEPEIKDWDSEVLDSLPEGPIEGLNGGALNYRDSSTGCIVSNVIVRATRTEYGIDLVLTDAANADDGSDAAIIWPVAARG